MGSKPVQEVIGSGWSSGAIHSAGIFALMLLLAHTGISCLSLQPALVSEEPDLYSVPSSSPRESNESGQRRASLELVSQAKSRIEKGSLGEAQSILQKSISLDSSNPFAYYYFAKTRYLEGDFLQVLPLLGQAERYFENNAQWLSWVYDLRGKTYEALFRFNEAREQFQLALSENPGNLDALDGLTRLNQNSSE